MKEAVIRSYGSRSRHRCRRRRRHRSALLLRFRVLK